MRGTHHVEETPGRPPVVLLHHAANSLCAWSAFVPGIGGHRPLARDRRSFGSTPGDAVFDARLFEGDPDELAAAAACSGRGSRAPDRPQRGRGRGAAGHAEGVARPPHRLERERFDREVEAHLEAAEGGPSSSIL